MARKADSKYTYAWFISLDYDAWARSLPWIQEQVLANYNAGIITGDQVKKIWEHHEQLVQQMLDTKNKKTPPKVIVDEHAPPGGSLGSATAGKSIYDTLFGPGTILDRIGGSVVNGSGSIAEGAKNVGSAIVGGVSIGNYVVLGGLIFIIIKIFKR